MCLGVQEDGQPIEDPNIPSPHKYGAVDLDPDFNWPKHGRGDIPDEVLLAMAEAGFNLGAMGDETASHYLIGDFTHFQMRYLPPDPAAQALFDKYPIGRRYWEKVKPMLEAIRQQTIA